MVFCRMLSRPLSGQEKVRNYSYKRLTLNVQSVSAIALSPHGTMVAVGVLRPFGKGEADNEIKVLDVGTGIEKQVFTGHTSTVRAIQFSSDGRFLLSGSNDKTVRLWDTKSGRQLHVFRPEAGYVNQVAFVNAGNLAVSAASNLTVWDLKNRKKLHTLAVPAEDLSNPSGGSRHLGGITALATSLDGDRVIAAAEIGQYNASSATGQDNYIHMYMWQVTNGNLMLRFQPFLLDTGDYISTLAWSPNGNFVTIGTIAGNLKIYADTGMQLSTLKLASGISGFTFSSTSNSIIISGKNGAINLVQMDNNGRVLSR